MEFYFGNLLIRQKDDRIYVLTREDALEYAFQHVHISGEMKDSHLGTKLVKASEDEKLKYVSHELNGNNLTIVQRSEKVEVTTYFEKFDDTNAIAVKTEVKNVSDGEINLEEVSSFSLNSVCGGTVNADKTWLYRFIQSHHTECQAHRLNLAEAYGMMKAIPMSQRRINGTNVGSWSTKEELPQGILEYDGKFLMFQIESNNSWYWEISDIADELYLYLGHANLPTCGWEKELQKGQSYVTDTVSVCFGESLDDVLGNMTKYRRHIKGKCVPDENLPTIFNEYMHLSWDCPLEERTREIAPVVASLGVKYYVIDCGWHNEEDTSIIYPVVGQWKESNKRFPAGVRATTDYIRSLGMKPGLWIEPEIIGWQCAEMLGFYDDDCFISRHGKRLCVMGRCFLDYRNKKVLDYMNETIRRMVEDYGAEYIKLDYNQDLGIGTDKDSDSYGEGLEQTANAYLAWVDGLKEKFPQVLFETCSSGGMRMDYKTLRHFSIISTSDQVNYKLYPYIAGNVLSAVLPEQAAVWAYPVDNVVATDEREKKLAYVKENITEDQVVMNMINSFLGRMHLASDLSLLSEKEFALVKEGVDYFDGLTAVKKEGLPVLPLGFSNFGDKHVTGGFIAKGKIYLAVWNLGGEKEFFVPLENYALKNVVCAYPKANSYKVKLKGKGVSVKFNADYQAAFLEIETK